MNFTPIDNKGLVEGFCIIKDVAVKTSSKGDSYLDITLGDKEGEINAKLWRYNQLAHGVFNVNDIVKIRGEISVYNGSDQLRIDRIRVTEEADGVKIEDFIRASAYSGEEMYDELLNTAKAFADNDLNKIVTSILEDNRIKLLYWPAAFKLHHAIRGGLLLHTLSIVRLAENVSAIYPFVDKDLLIAGAILHDIAKLTEFIVADTGIASGYSVEGNLIGHLAKGAMVIDSYAKKLNTNEELALLLEHMVLSHHGEPEYGAAVRPLFIEAEILSELDMMDSRIYAMREAIGNTTAKDFSSKIWSMENRKLYNHDRTDMNNETKIF